MQDAPTQSDSHNPLPWVEKRPVSEVSVQIGKTSDLQVII
jgi:hypothetical protein